MIIIMLEILRMFEAPRIVIKAPIKVMFDLLRQLPTEQPPRKTPNDKPPLHPLMDISQYDCTRS